MSLKPSTRVGAYEIQSALGAGGMGEVYRARDTRLKRDVALKVLPEGFAQNPDRVARFQREAELLATLNHPNIAAVHGFEEADGLSAMIVMELVEGETLAERLKRGPLPIDDALALARQIVDALGAAHDKGIIHRDLKPANIALTSTDQIKVLDFGLARALETGASTDVSHSPTLTFHATQAGVILGTAAYMSPEQAKGCVADKRSDVWAFGCVLYEMLCGRRAFDGEDVSDTLAAVLRGDPDWAALPESVPFAIRRLVQQCLVKDRHLRIADVAVAAYVLRDPLSGVGSDIQAVVQRGPRFGARLAIGAAVLVAFAGTVGWMLSRPAAPRQPPTRFAIGISSDQVISELVRRRHLLALSPDGTRLAYAANNQIYLRAMDQFEAAPIRGTNDSPVELVFFTRRAVARVLRGRPSQEDFRSAAARRSPSPKRPRRSACRGRGIGSCSPSPAAGFSKCRLPVARQRCSCPAAATTTARSCTAHSCCQTARRCSSPSVRWHR